MRFRPSTAASAPLLRPVTSASVGYSSLSPKRMINARSNTAGTATQEPLTGLSPNDSGFFITSISEDDIDLPAVLNSNKLPSDFRLRLLERDARVERYGYEYLFFSFCNLFPPYVYKGGEKKW